MNILTQSRRAVAATTATGLLLASAAACGDGETLAILSPGPGAEVKVPFEVTFDSSAALGSPVEELHHLHVWFSEDETAYLVAESTTVEIAQAPPGEQELHASLRKPDHTRAGVETSIRLLIVPEAGE
jgi:hypothetical protein